LETILVKWR